MRIRLRRPGNLALLAMSLSVWVFFPCGIGPRSACAQERKIKVALYVDRGASDQAKAAFERMLSGSDDIQYQTVYGDDIRQGVLNGFDALVVPGGSARKDALSMGPAAREEVRRFVAEGGIYMGTCAGAYLCSQASDRYLGLLPLRTVDQEHWYRVKELTPVDVELTPAGMEVFGLTERNVRIRYENGPIFGPPEQPVVPSFTPLGYFRSEVVAPGGQPGVMLRAPAMILSRYGRGVVLAISPHPEQTPGLVRMDRNALRWLYEHRAPGSRFPAAAESVPAQARAAAAAPLLAPRQGQATSDTSPSTDREDSPLSRQALQLAISVFSQANVVKYVHRHVPAGQQILREPDGSVGARTDCSGFISFVVNDVAPRHYKVVREREPEWSYPQAKIWAHFFDTLDNNVPKYGWLGIRNWRDLRPGDIIAWTKGVSASKENTNTGHVMMVVGRPGEPQHEGGDRFIEIPVIDSSTTYHFAPERLPPNAHQDHRDGLGMGSVRIILSEKDEPIGYWAGTYWGEGHEAVNHPTASEVVRFARMVPLQETETD